MGLNRINIEVGNGDSKLQLRIVYIRFSGRHDSV